MKRPLRCTLTLHRWVTKQDSPDSPRYVGCARCDALLDNRPDNMEAGPNLYSQFDRDDR